MIYNRAQIAAAWCEAGGDPGKSALAAAVALAESGGKTDAAAYDLAGGSAPARAGLWMANPADFPLVHLTDAVSAAREAVNRSDNGRDWSQFDAYKYGAYLQFLPNPGPHPVNPVSIPRKWRAFINVQTRYVRLEITRHSEQVTVTITTGRGEQFRAQ